MTEEFREVRSSWNVMAHGDAWEGKWRGNWRMEWVAGTLHTDSERGVSNITTADAHTSADSSRLNWRPRRFKWTRPFRRKTKSVSLRVCHHISNAVYLSVVQIRSAWVKVSHKRTKDVTTVVGFFGFKCVFFTDGNVLNACCEIW